MIKPLYKECEAKVRTIKMSQPKYKEKHAKAMQKLCLKSIYKQKVYVQKKIDKQLPNTKVNLGAVTEK